MIIKKFTSDYTKQIGAGLIEVMVSLLILGVGLLGVLSLQAKGLNSGQRAEFVGQAQLLAQDMADRILAFGNGAVGGTAVYGGTDTTTTYTDPSCSGHGGSGCDADNTVAYDRFQWTELFTAAALPGGYGTVAWNDPVYTITIRWDQDRTGAAGTNCNSNDKSSSGNLSCFVMEVRL